MLQLIIVQKCTQFNLHWPPAFIARRASAAKSPHRVIEQPPVRRAGRVLPISDARRKRLFAILPLPRVGIVKKLLAPPWDNNNLLKQIFLRFSTSWRGMVNARAPRPRGSASRHPEVVVQRSRKGHNETMAEVFRAQVATGAAKPSASPLRRQGF